MLSGDPDTTLQDLELFEGARPALALQDLLAWLTAAIQAHEGCEKVSVVGVARLDPPEKSGCNWSSSLVLDAAGVQPEVYSLAYAAVIAEARKTWNLK